MIYIICDTVQVDGYRNRLPTVYLTVSSCLKRSAYNKKHAYNLCLPIFRATFTGKTVLRDLGGTKIGFVNTTVADEVGIEVCASFLYLIGHCFCI